MMDKARDEPLLEISSYLNDMSMTLAINGMKYSLSPVVLLSQ